MYYGRARGIHKMISKIKTFMIVLFFPLVFPVALLWAVAIGAFDIDYKEQLKDQDDEM